MGFDCGGTSYEGLKADFEAMVQQGVKTVAMMIDSPGGEAYAMMDTANYIRNLADANGVDIIAYVDGLSASAGYGLTAIADQIISSKDSELGSIGVLIRLMNDSKKLEKEGIERTFITAGKEKIPFTEDGGFRKEFLEDLQHKVDVLYEEFTGHVAKYRNMSVEAVRDTQAKTFLAQEAVELGLADKVMTLEEFYEYLAETAQTNKGSVMKDRIFKFNKKEEISEMTQLADLQAQLQAREVELTALSEKLEAFASMEGLVAQLQEALADKETQLSQAAEQIAQMETQAKVAKEAARKEKLSAVMAAEQVEGVAASLASLDDEAFATVLSGFAAQKQAIAQSDLMQELGQDVDVVEEAESDAAPKLSTTDKILQERLQNKR
jgi:signal peptide peptidase SppA